MSDIAARFRELVSGLSASESKEADLVLLQLAPELAQRIRLCAIPHLFNDAILRVLDPALDAAAVAATLAEFEKLPAVITLPGGFALHDVVRQQLFAQWLEADRINEFRAASRRMAEYCLPKEGDAATQAATRSKAFIFHLLGADLVRGFEGFELAYRKAREEARFGDCEALVALVREYQAILGPQLTARLAYYEAEIASDHRDWTQARTRLEGLLKTAPDVELKARVLLALGSVARRTGQFAAARSYCEQALGLAQSPEGKTFPERLVHYELGILERDQGNFDAARAQLEMVAAMAKADGERLPLATALNSLGMLLMKAMPDQAVAMFESCMALLEPTTDGIRIAQVMNNLGMAKADLQEWQASESYYRQSLEIKRNAKDLYGEALTLLNLARVYHAEGKRAEARAALARSAELFNSVRDPAHAARANRELARLVLRTDKADAMDHANKAYELFELVGDEDEMRVTNREFRLRKQPSIWSKAASFFAGSA
jgi:tetratricopeptide (TPR) repeat protein